MTGFGSPDIGRMNQGNLMPGPCQPVGIFINDLETAGRMAGTSWQDESDLQAHFAVDCLLKTVCMICSIRAANVCASCER